MDVLTAIDVPMFDKVNAIGGVAVVILTYALGDHWYLFGAFLLLNIFDYVTGLMKAKVLKEESSSAGLLGVIKKLSYWIMVCLAFLVGSFMTVTGDMIGTDLSMFTPAIGWFILATLAINEIRSILENLLEIGVPVPTWLIKGLKVAADQINRVGEAAFDGELDVDTKSDDAYQVHIDTPPEKLVEKDAVTLKIRTINDEEE